MKTAQRWMVGLLALGTLAAPLALAQPVADDGPKLKLTPESWDFGTKIHGEPAETEVVIENIGKAPLMFSIRSSCGCTAVTQLTQAERVSDGTFQYQLAPGKSDKLKVTYNTNKQTPTVSQIITLTTNDPANSSYQFRVTGTLKNLFAMTMDDQPGDRVFFQGIDRTTKASRVMTLRNNFEEPVKLKMLPIESTAFDVKFEEIKPGMEYKLTVDTHPPLTVGANATEVILEADNAGRNQIRVPVSAYIAPRISLSPQTINVNPGTTAPITRRVMLTYQQNQPLTIQGFESSLPGLSARQLTTNEGRGMGGAVARHEIEVTIPPASQIPDEGGVITIITDDLEPEFQRMQVKVAKSPVRPARRAAQQPQEIQEQSVAKPGDE